MQELQIERFKSEGIAHISYLIGTNGIGILIDPRRDIDCYLQSAASKGLCIKYIFQTHQQEDFIMGSAAIKRILDVKIVGGDHPFSSYCDKRMRDDEEIEIGKLIFKALHTPGHTPESVCFAVSKQQMHPLIWGVFTGDTLFVGETGRTDLPDATKTAENAGLLFNSVHSKLLPLGDHVLIFPAHGSGSVCGGTIASFDESTIGFERRNNAVFTHSREQFIEQKLQLRIPRPPYFRAMENANRKGGLEMPAHWNIVSFLQPEEFARQSANGLIIDTRSMEAFAAGHIPRSYSIWLNGLPVFAGWISPGNQHRIYLVLETHKDVKTALLHLARIGNDNVKGILAGGFDQWRNLGFPIETFSTISASQLKDSKYLEMLDIREVREYEEGHIPRALNAYVGHLPEHLHDINLRFSKEMPLVVACSVGHRGSLAASILQLNGYSRVCNLIGGMNAIKCIDGIDLKFGPGDSQPLDLKSILRDHPTADQHHIVEKEE